MSVTNQSANAVKSSKKNQKRKGKREPKRPEKNKEKEKEFSWSPILCPLARRDTCGCLVSFVWRRNDRNLHRRIRRLSRVWLLRVASGRAVARSARCSQACKGKILGLLACEPPYVL